MSTRRVIPTTPIVRRYRLLREQPQAARLEVAEGLVERPWELAAEFAESVRRFASYENLRDPFYPPDRARRAYSDAIGRTNDLVLRLEEQGTLAPVDARTGFAERPADGRVRAVDAGDLVVDYVDRELLVQRTTSPAAWDDGTHNRGGTRLDVLLADARDRTPIVGELKLPGDMDPFFALVQALACAANLATPNQYERMRRHLHRVSFPRLDDGAAPRLDVALLVVDPPGNDPLVPPKGRYMARLTAAAEALAPALLEYDDITRSIRRVFALGVKLAEGGVVTSDVRWGWERA